MFMEHLKELPKEWIICYQRKSHQYDFQLKEWVDRSLYIRAVQGNRYKNHDLFGKFDKLLLVGTFNHKNGEYEEFAYNDESDVCAMWHEIFMNFVKLEERERKIKQLRTFLSNELNHTLK